MTSQINTASINQLYPVAGIDNDSQGFRDNFTAIASALSTAKNEITSLQDKALLRGTLAIPSTPVVNDLLGSTLSNGLVNSLSEVSYGPTVISGTTDVNLLTAATQIFKLSAAATLRFINWPNVGSTKIKIHLLSTGTVPVPAVGAPYSVSFATEGGGTIRLPDGWAALTVNATGDHKVIEAWSYDNGANVFIRLLGSYVVS